MLMTRKFVAAAWLLGIGVTVLLGTPASAPGAATEEPEDKNWRAGPVKYLLTKEEDKKFRALSTPQARAEFVREFWNRRDRTPGTPANEFRDEYWGRVEEANQAFPTLRGGWTTDPGRILILFGPPASQHRDTNPDGVLQRVRWEYAADGALGRAVTVIFTPEAGAPAGEEPVLVLANLRDVDGILAGRQELIGLGAKPEIPAAPAPPAAAAAPQAPAPEAAGGRTVSEAALRLLEGLAAGAADRREIRLQSRWDYFEAEDVTTHAALTLGVIPPPAEGAGESNPGDDLEVFARLLPDDPVLDPADLTGADSFARAEEMEAGPSGPFRLYQARVSVPPGRYRLLAGVRHREDGRAGTLQERVVVPDFSSPELALSSITLANSIHPADGDSDSGAFTFGAYRVVPRIEPVFRTSEELSFYFQVYNAKRDPATERPSLDVKYEFLVKQGSGYQVAASVPKNGQETAALGFSLALQGWPATDYRLRVKVTDRIAGTSAYREIDFRVQ